MDRVSFVPTKNVCLIKEDNWEPLLYSVFQIRLVYFEMLLLRDWEQYQTTPQPTMLSCWEIYDSVAEQIDGWVTEQINDSVAEQINNSVAEQFNDSVAEQI